MQSKELANCIISFFIGVYILIWYFSYQSVPNIWLHELKFFVFLVCAGVLANLLSTSKKWPGFCMSFPLVASMTILSIGDAYNSIWTEFVHLFVPALVFSMSAFLANFLAVKLMMLYLSMKQAQ